MTLFELGERQKKQKKHVERVSRTTTCGRCRDGWIEVWYTNERGLPLPELEPCDCQKKDVDTTAERV